MRVVLTLNSYSNLTGSEIYTYELARELSRRDYKVTILANKRGGEILKRTEKFGRINVYPFFAHPELSPNLVINSQPLPTVYALRFFSHPEITHMQVIHSLFQYEEPVIDPQIKRYIAVRPDVKAAWEEKMPKIRGKVSIVWNGVDKKRFNENHIPNNKGKIRIFVGTVDYLRKHVITDLLNESAANPQLKLWLVLPVNPFKDTKLPENVKIFDSRWDSEILLKQADETAGIFIGRTTIEGFMMGKPALIYDVDLQGNIIKKYNMTVPENREMFDIEFMVDRILELYNKHRYD